MIYARATYASGSPTSTLVLSKTRVAPLDERTIPELELCGAHLLARILSATSETLSVSKDNVFAYTDSSIVLAWLDGKPKRYRLYVANRISKTLRLLPSKHRNYVPTELNPADCASRGITAQELVAHQLWWQGPPWLQKQPLRIPALPTPSVSREEEEVYFQEAESQIASAVVASLDTRLEDCSNSLAKVIRVTCWVRRFMAKARKGTASSAKYLSVAEYIEAEDFLHKRAQARSFGPQIQHIKSKSTELLSRRSHLLGLHPEINKKGLLCVGGRLRNALISDTQKHPVILSCRDTLTRKLFDHYHIELHHGGPTAILAHSGNLFYVSGARKLARSVCSKCIECRKASAKVGSQLMGQLPPSRLNPEYVFYHTGLDYAGPYETKDGYVCFYTKAVHLDIVKDNTTESLVACLSRFCSRRGLPRTLHSDNGSNLVGAKNELEELYQTLEQPETQNAIQSYSRLPGKLPLLGHPILGVCGRLP